MRIVVTGANGNLGRQVVKILHESHPEWDVVGFDLSAGAQNRSSVVVGDITNQKDLETALQRADVVVHLAGVRRPGLTDDLTTFSVNTIGTFLVFDVAARSGVGRVIFSSSTAVIGTDWGRRDRAPDYLPYDEEHPTGPEDPYGLSKQISEAVARSFYLRGDLEVAVLRFPWIPTAEEMESLRESGGREPGGLHHYAYIDVRDAAEAILRSIELDALGYELLFVSADDSTLNEPLSVVLPRELPAIGEMAASFKGVESALRNERAKEVLGWSPSHSWRNGR